MMLDEETLAQLTNRTFCVEQVMTGGLRVDQGNGGTRPNLDRYVPHSCERRDGCPNPPERGKLGCRLHELMAPRG